MVLQEVLAPADQVHVRDENPDLATTDRQLVRAQVVALLLVERVRAVVGLVAVDRTQVRVDALQLPAHRQPEGVDGTLQPLEDVHPHQVDQALLSVGLLETTLATLQASRVLIGVLGPFVRSQVVHGRVRGQIELADLVVEFPDGTEVTLCVDIRLHVERREALGKDPVSAVP